MMKKLLFGATLAAAALASTQLLADPAGHRHGQNTPCTGTHCSPATATGEHGQHGMGQGGMRGKMQAMRGEHPGKHPGQDAQGMGRDQHGKAGKGCPMHNERKPT